MAYSANGYNFPSKALSRVRYDITYNAGDYTMPKAPELIKIGNVAATDIFFDTSSDNDPIIVDMETIDLNYGDQIFTNVPEQVNMIWVPDVLTGDCLAAVNQYVKNYDWILANGFWDDNNQWNDGANWID